MSVSPQLPVRPTKWRRKNRNRSRFVRPLRTGSVYVAVLGTSLIVSLLALSALALQRIQNRMLDTSADIRQAQLNAEAAIELGLLAMKQDTNWRTSYTNGRWIANRSLAAGTCSLDGIDPVDGNLANNTTDPVVFTGIGDCGSAEQRVQVVVDPRTQPLSCLRSGVAAGHAVALSGSVLRSSGLISANTASASLSTVYGNVQATAISGSTYAGTSTQISSSQLPTMPTWSTVFDYYKTNGTQLDVSRLLVATTNNFARNPGLEDGTSTAWTGSPLGSSSVATVAPSQTKVASGNYSLKVSSRSDYAAGAAQYIDDYVLPGQSYSVSCNVQLSSGTAQSFAISLCTKGSGAAQTSPLGGTATVQSNAWKPMSATLQAPSWSGNLAYAYVKIAGAAASNTGNFYVDDLTIRESTSGKLIYQQVLGPGVNTLYSGAPTNAQGIYWIDCGNNKLTIARSRIKGTLLVINPGVGSCIGGGPIRWAPAVAGYPALLVHADTASNANFSILATNHVLSETQNGVNYNPAGAPSDEFGQDTDTKEIYASEISGLVAVEHDLTYQNNGLIRGAVIVGNDLLATGGSLEVAYQPESLLNPPPGFTGTNAYVRRPASTTKIVLP